MRMCGHAHHDDMLYLGKDPQPSWDVSAARPSRATPTASCYEFWAARDPIPDVRRAARGRRRHRRGRSRRAQARGRGARRSAGASGDRGAVARAGDAGVGVFADEPPRVRVEVLDPDRAASRVELDPALPPVDAGPPFDQEGQHVPRSGHARRRRRAARPIRACSSTARTSAATYGNAFLLLRPLLEGVRRSHPQLAARRRRGARRLRRRGARRAAADRRDAVQRLRRDRLQSAREQRREDPLSLGRIGADGRAHAVGRPAPRRAVPHPEHRAVVLPHARARRSSCRRRRTTRAR